MKTYTIIGGVNGTGKSSLTGALRSERSDLGVIIDVDKIAAENGNGVVTAGRKAVTKINECIAGGISFTQETTLSGYKTERTIRAAKEHGYIVRLFYIGLNSCGECQKRIRNRVEKGGHDICTADVERRFEARFEALAKVLPYCDKAVLFDNENGFVEVAEYKNEEVITKGSYKPEWLNELMAMLSSK